MSIAALGTADVRPGLDEQSRFDAIITGLLAGFLSSPDNLLDSKIVEALRRIAEFLGLDQGILVQWGEDPSRFQVSHSWTVRGGLPVSPASQLPATSWVHQCSAAGQIVMFSSVDELPSEAEQDRKFFRAAGTRAMVSLPLKLGGRTVGALAFASQTAETFWPDEVVRRLMLIAGVFGGALDRSKRQLELEEQLRYEALLADMSARFVNIPATEVDAAIEDAQRLVCEHLRLDRSALWQVCSEGPDVLLLTHLHQPADGPAWQKRSAPSPLSSCYWAQTSTMPLTYVRLDVKALFPWIYEQIHSGRTVVLRKLDDLPEAATADTEMLRQFQTVSTVIVPLSIGGAWLGCLTFASMRQCRHWSDEQVRRFQFVADVFANALARRRTDQELRKSEERLQMATESASVGLWSMDIRSGRIWVTAKTREILGLAMDGELTDGSLFATVHPEDCEAVRQAVRKALQTRTGLSIDYRIVMPDGSFRWIVARGRSHCNAQAEPEYLMGVAVDITERKRTEDELHRALAELRPLQEQLRQENLYLRTEIHASRGTMSIVGNSDSLMKVIRQAERVATTDATVLILGETGTGKELLAQYMHRTSGRAAKPFIATNIAAIPATLLESELFGREKGAYTGALTKELGRFEMANGGTLFLDEIGEMPMETQVKLLRVLQTGQFERLGSGRTLRADVRIMAATNRELPELIKAGAFRQDLFYRLNVFPLTLPPLRKRLDDIPLLVWAFVSELSDKMGRTVERIRKKDMDALLSYDWPGNVRELRNVVERSMILSEGPELRLSLPDAHAIDDGRSSRLLADVEKQHIQSVLESTRNRIRGAGGAAEVLGLKPTTLYSLMKRLGIGRDDTRRSIVDASMGRRARAPE